MPTNPEHVSTFVKSEQSSLRVRRYTDAVNELVPLRVTVFTPAPVKLPWRTSYGATFTCTCSMASSEIGATPVRSPMPPVVTPEPERVVEVRAVDGHVVRAIVLAGERAGAAVLRRQARDVGDAARDRRQSREILAHDGRGRAGVRRAEHRIARADDGNRFGNRGDLQRELELLRHAEAQGQVVLDGSGESRQRRSHVVRTADAHAGNEESTIGLRNRFVDRAGRFMGGGDVRARNDLPLIVLDDAGGGCGRDALREAPISPQQSRAIASASALEMLRLMCSPC